MCILETTSPTPASLRPLLPFALSLSVNPSKLAAARRFNARSLLPHSDWIRFGNVTSTVFSSSSSTPISCSMRRSGWIFSSNLVPKSDLVPVRATAEGADAAEVPRSKSMSDTLVFGTLFGLWYLFTYTSISTTSRWLSAVKSCCFGICFVDDFIFVATLVLELGTGYYIYTRYEKEGKPSELLPVDIFVSTVDPKTEFIMVCEMNLEYECFGWRCSSRCNTWFSLARSHTCR